MSESSKDVMILKANDDLQVAKVDSAMVGVEANMVNLGAEFAPHVGDGGASTGGAKSTCYESDGDSDSVPDIVDAEPDSD